MMNRVCVRLRDWDETALAAVAASVGGTVFGASIPALHAFRIEIADTADTAAALATLRANPLVVWAEPDAAIPLQPMSTYYASQNDPLLHNQWHLIRHGIPQAWRHTTGDSAIKVCVVDSGLYRKSVNEWHPDLPTMPDAAKWNAHKNNLDIGEDIEGFIDDLYGPNEHFVFSIHGIEVLGIIIAKRNNASGGAGVAPGLTPLFGRMTYLTGQLFPNDGAWGIYEASQCITHFTDLGAKVFNLSFGATWSYDPVNRDLLQAAIEYAWAAGAIIVVAAGNEGADLGLYAVAPACMTHTVTVANIGGPRQSDTNWTPLSGYTDEPGYDSGGLITNYGAPVDVCAVGLDTFLPALDEVTGAQSWGFHGGTSFAAPLTAGICGLILSVNPALTNQQAIDILYATAEPPRQEAITFYNLATHSYLHSTWHTFFPNAGIANAHKAVLKALTTVPANAGLVYPYFAAWDAAGVYGVGAAQTYSGGAITTTLDGSIRIEIGAYSSEAVTSVELWLGDVLVYSGAPGVIACVAASDGAAKTVTVVARTASGSGSESYDDVIVSSLVAPAFQPATEVIEAPSGGMGVGKGAAQSPWGSGGTILDEVLG